MSGIIDKAPEAEVPTLSSFMDTKTHNTTSSLPELQQSLLEQRTEIPSEIIVHGIRKHNPEYRRIEYLLHREKILQSKKRYNEEHKEELREKQRLYRLANHDKVLEQARKYHSKNRELILERERAWRKGNREYVLNRSRKYRRKNRERYVGYALKRHYGMTLEQYRTLLQSQSRLCGICHCSLVGLSRVCVDHDHGSNRIRGLLCNDCNLMLGYAQDSITRLQAGIVYLQTSALTR